MLSFIRSFVKVSDNFSSFPLIHFTIKLSKFIALLSVKAKISSINSFGTQPICSVNESVHINTLIPITSLPDLSVTFARRKISFSLLPSPSKSLIAFWAEKKTSEWLVPRNSKFKKFFGQKLSWLGPGFISTFGPWHFWFPTRLKVNGSVDTQSPTLKHEDSHWQLTTSTSWCKLENGTPNWSRYFLICDSVQSFAKIAGVTLLSNLSFTMAPAFLRFF